jgi:hypothetical protein
LAYLLIHLLLFSFVKKSLERICTSLQKQGTISSFDESTLKGAISKEKLQREIEWQRLHPGMDALLSHRKTNYAERQDDDEIEEENENSGSVVINSDEDMEMAALVPKKRGTSSSSTTATAKRATTTSTRGRGRARGRGSSASVLSMSTDAPPSLPSTPSAASRWPPRR